MPQASVRKLLVVNQYYAPDLASTGQLAAEICGYLAKRGVEAHVVTAQPCYTASSPEAPLYEAVNGVHVHRVPMGRLRGRERMVVRVAGYLRFLWGAWRMARKLAKSERPDVVLTFHNPPFVGLIGAYLAHKYGARFVYAPYDIHPDILVATRWTFLPRPIIWLWERLNRWILRSAETVVVLGEGMRRTLVEGKGVPLDKVKVIPTWGRPELKPMSHKQPIRGELGISEGELLLLYSGNMGIMHPLDPILDAAALLRGEPVRFLFVGDGAKRQHLVKRVEKEGLDQVSFLPFQPEDRFIQLVAASDACLVALEPGLERLAVPSRAYTFLSAGRPLITIMAPEADIARLVTEQGCGWNVTTGEELAELIRQLLSERQELVRRGERARAVYEERFQRERVLEQYARIILAQG
ncbi:MAG TPA: glycosyltransferase WbuB [Candidatus Acetothermia bacterium]|nr:glycosyltransferase WbuB [Candidatus Acetothermia bacterium]